MKLILQLLNSIGRRHLSIVIASATLCLGPPSSGTVTVASVISFGKEVVGMKEVGTAIGGFELIAGSVSELQPILVLLSALEALYIEPTQGHLQLVVGE